MSRITFAEDAWDEYLYWQSQDKKTLKKINALLKEIQRTPFEGSGKPEPVTIMIKYHFFKKTSDFHFT